MREVLMVYLGGVILLLAVSTMIDEREGVGLDHILIAGFGWPILTPILPCGLGVTGRDISGSILK